MKKDKSNENFIFNSVTSVKRLTFVICIQCTVSTWIELKKLKMTVMLLKYQFKKIEFLSMTGNLNNSCKYLIKLQCNLSNSFRIFS